MNFYERINKKSVVIPERFDLRYSQYVDLKNNAPGKFELISTVFTFGYIQGVRAERAGRAEI